MFDDGLFKLIFWIGVALLGGAFLVLGVILGFLFSQ